MAKRMSGSQILDDMSKGSRTPLKDILVDLKVSSSNPEVVKTIRPIGDSIQFREAQPKKRSESDPKNPVKVEFPDKELNNAFTRICEDDLENDPWIKMGYMSSKRYAINVIERGDPKKGTSDVVKILSKGKGVFEEFFKKEKFNKALNAEGKKGVPHQFERIGAEIARDWVITATYAPDKLGNVNYDIDCLPYDSPVTEEEIELLRAAGQPTAEQLEAIRSENPDLADRADLEFYGYNLEERFAPTPPRSPKSQETSAEDMEMDAFPDEEEVAKEEVKTAPKVKSKKPEVVDEDDDELAGAPW
jgi:hypothetical protein